MDCPVCQKTLRKDNTRGACADCINQGKAPHKAANPGIERRFRSAAKALGEDPDAILARFMNTWLRLKTDATPRAE